MKEATVAAALALALACFGSQAMAEPGRVGAMIDAGIPDGLVASLVVRPVPKLKLHGGVGYNLISPGVRVGASVAPVLWWITPSLNVEAGRYFIGDANRAAAMFEPEPAPDAEPVSEEDGDNPVLREVGYDFANFHIGIEIGSPRFSFYLQAGFSAVRGEIRNLEEARNEDMTEGDPRVVIREDPTLRLWIPSARAGFILFY